MLVWLVFLSCSASKCLLTSSPRWRDLHMKFSQLSALCFHESDNYCVLQVCLRCIYQILQKEPAWALMYFGSFLFFGKDNFEILHFLLTVWSLLLIRTTIRILCGKFVLVWEAIFEYLTVLRTNFIIEYPSIGTVEQILYEGFSLWKRIVYHRKQLTSC